MKSWAGLLREERQEGRGEGGADGRKCLLRQANLNLLGFFYSFFFFFFFTLLQISGGFLCKDFLGKSNRMLCQWDAVTAASTVN